LDYTVVKYLQKKKPLALYPDLSEYEMYAIGKMTASWGLLESQLLSIALELADHSHHSLPPDFVTNNSMSKTLKELKAITNSIVRPVEVKIFLESILKRVHRLKSQRHTLTHGMFSWDDKNPAKLKVQTRKRKQQSERFDADKIDRLAEKIGELNFEIMYPRGEKQYLKERVEIGHAISRRFAIALAKAHTNDRTLKFPPEVG